MSTYRVLVTGSRDWVNHYLLEEALFIAAVERPAWRKLDPVVVHGACPRGADAMADALCRKWDVPVEAYPALWAAYGKRAGFIRNKLMVDAGADLCLAFIRNGSRGATGCRNLAEEAGITTFSFLDDAPAIPVTA